MKNATKLTTDKSLSDKMPQPVITTQKDEQTPNAVDMHVRECNNGSGNCKTTRSA